MKYEKEIRAFFLDNGKIVKNNDLKVSPYRKKKNYLF